MATAVMQVVVAPLSSSRRACFSANAHTSNVAAVKFRNGASSHRLCNDLGERNLRCPLFVSRCSSEKAAYAVKEVTDEDLEKQVQQDDIRVLAAIKSRYNNIAVMEVAQEADHLLAGARILLLDNPGCIHTVYYPHNILTNSYYDALATLVPLLAEGPLGVLGLGAGAVPHIVHHFFPEKVMHGWELDPDIVQIARQFFDMEELESGDGIKALIVHVGDALSEDACVEGGFAGLVVDLFAEGRVVPALQQVGTWEGMKAKLRPGGRIIVNCGGDRMTPGNQTKSPGQIHMEETIAAMRQVFGGELSTRYLARKGFNTIAITGPAPDVDAWTQALPEPLRDGIHEWKPVY